MFFPRVCVLGGGLLGKGVRGAEGLPPAEFWGSPNFHLGGVFPNCIHSQPGVSKACLPAPKPGWAHLKRGVHRGGEPLTCDTAPAAAGTHL